MGYSIIPSGSIGSGGFRVPDWARRRTQEPADSRWGIEIGCLVRVLPAGRDWYNELVVVLKEMPQEPEYLCPMYQVVGRKGTAIMPYYALSVERYIAKKA